MIKWVNRRHGKLDHNFTQVVIGHGVFNAFRKKIGKSLSEECWYWGETSDTAEHTVFICDGWIQERRELEIELGDKFHTVNLIANMLADEKSGTR